MLSTLRYSLRQLRLSPVFSLAAVLTLALGIGGTTAIFTLINAVMLRSLPVSDPGLLYRIGSGDDCCGLGWLQNRWGLFSYSFFQRLATAAPELEQVKASRLAHLSLPNTSPATTFRPSASAPTAAG